MATFLRATCFSQVKLSLIMAIKHENLATWPGLPAELISKHLPKSEATKLDICTKSKNTMSKELIIWHSR